MQISNLSPLSRYDSFVDKLNKILGNSGIDYKLNSFNFFVGLNYGSSTENNKRFILENRFVEIPDYLQANANVTYRGFNKFDFINQAIVPLLMFR